MWQSCQPFAKYRLDLEYRMYKPPTTIKQLHTNMLNQAIFISESAAVTYPQTV